MSYQSTITKKGQITIPKKIRDALDLDTLNKVVIEFKEGDEKITVRPPRDFLELARAIRVKRKIDPVKAREYMEKHYERR